MAGTLAPIVRTAAHADVLLRGGAVLADPGDADADGTAIALAAGAVLAVGGDELDALIGPETVIVELDGRAVVPGLIDDHLHLAAYGMSLSGDVDVSPASLTAWPALGAALRGAHPDGSGWIRCRGWDDAVLGRPGRTADVDAALAAAGLAGVPSVLFDMTGHRLLLGTAGLDATGLSASRAHTDGCFVDGAMEVALERMPQLDRAALERGILAAQRDLLDRGITGVTDPGLGPGGRALLDGASGTVALDAYRSIEARGELVLRTSVLVLCSGTGGASAAETKAVLDGGLAAVLDGADVRRLVVRGVKVFADGTPRSGTAWFSDPYRGAAQGGSMVVAGADAAERVRELDEIIETIVRAGLSAHVHATGDATAAAAVRSMVRHPTTTGAHTIIHGDFLTDATLHRMATHGIRWTANPEIARSAAPITEAIVGVERASRRVPLEQALVAGVVASISSDAPVVDPDWRRSLHAAITRPFGASTRPSMLTTRQALALMTSAPACGDGTDVWRGTLLPGKVADLAVLDSGWPAQPDGLLDLAVHQTWIDGRRVGGDRPSTHTRRTS